MNFNEIDHTELACGSEGCRSGHILNSVLLDDSEYHKSRGDAHRNSHRTATHFNCNQKKEIPMRKLTGRCCSGHTMKLVLKVDKVLIADS